MWTVEDPTQYLSQKAWDKPETSYEAGGGKATEVDVLHKDTKVFCRVEDLEKKITISAKHKSAWSKAYEECINIFIEISM